MEKIETVDMVALARTASEAEGKLGIRVEDMAAGVDTLVGLIERSGLSKEERLAGIAMLLATAPFPREDVDALLAAYRASTDAVKEMTKREAARTTGDKFVGHPR